MSHSHPAPSPGDPPRSTRRSVPSSYGVIAFLWVQVHVKPCVCPPRVEFVSSVLWSCCPQAHWPLQWKLRIETNGPPGKSSSFSLDIYCISVCTSIHSQILWGSMSSVRKRRLGSLMWGSELTPMGNLCDVIIYLSPTWQVWALIKV